MQLAIRLACGFAASNVQNPVIGALAFEHFRRDPPRANPGGDRLQFLFVERRDETLGRRTGNRVDLHELQPSAGANFREPVAEGGRFPILARKRRRSA